MAKLTGRVAAYRHNTSDAGTSTTIFMADGSELTVDGHVHFLEGMTVEIKYQKRDDPEPHAIKSIIVTAG